MENEFHKYDKGKKKGEMKSHLSEAENNKLYTIKNELDRL